MPKKELILGRYLQADQIDALNNIIKVLKKKLLKTPNDTEQFYQTSLIGMNCIVNKIIFELKESKKIRHDFALC